MIPRTAKSSVTRLLFLKIAAVFQIVDGLQVAANGSLRGLKDTTAAMVLTLISYWLVGGVSGAYLCFWGGMGGVGLWIGMTLGLATAAVLLTVRFHHRVGKLVNGNETKANVD